MALATKVGSFTKPTATGNQSITGVGFQPKAIMVWTTGSNSASGTWTSYFFHCLGFSSGPTNSFCVASNSRDGVASANASRATTTGLIAVVDSGTLYDQASLVSFDADGFTINWSVINNGVAGQLVFNYTVFGGSDITNAKVVNWQQPAAVGSKAVTGVGFKPDLVFHAANGLGTGVTTNSVVCFGAMNKHGQQVANNTATGTGANPANTSRWQQTDACLVRTLWNETTDTQAHFTSMDADGFTTYFSQTPGANDVFSLCLKGVSSKIGGFIKPSTAAPAAQSITRVGFQPRAALFSMIDGAAGGALPTANWGLYATDGINSRSAHFYDSDNITPTRAKSVYLNDRAIIGSIGTGATTVDASATATLNSTGFDLSWSPNDTGTAEIIYIALGDVGIDTTPSNVISSSSATSTATATSNGRKIDRNQDGTLWAWDGISRLMYSKDNGLTWTVDTSNTFSSSSNISLFIDIDDYAHIIYKYSGDNYIYYNRGTPNAGRTSYTWSAGQVFNADVNYNFPDIVAHREGTGWKVHAVAGYLGLPTNNATHYARFNVTSGGTITRDTVGGIDSAGGSGYVAAVNTYPSIDFNHTGDGKTVAGGTPHLYAGWSAGKNGTGFGIRFKKATYSGGTWTWGTEREIDPNYHVATNQFFINCLFDGTRVIFPGMITDATTNEWITLHERDAADTTTTTRYLTNPNSAPDGVISGSASYDNLGNVYLIGRGEGATGYYLNLYKWTRVGASLNRTTIEPVGGASGNPFVSAKRGWSNNRVEWIYTSGDNSPYTVKYDYVATTPFGLFIKKVKTITDLYRDKMRARGFNI